MIPLSDDTRRRRTPFLNWLLILANVLVFLYQLSLGALVEQFVLAYGMIPAEMQCACDLPPARGPEPIYLTLLSSMFMHGGFLHIGSNMLYLWIFGDNVEDQLGHLRYLVFYLLGGVIASATHIFFSLGSQIPSVGASGAIAAVLGAYLLMFPHGRVRTLVFIGPFITTTRVSALLLIGFWAVVQVLSGLASMDVRTEQTSGVAYWAHVGGFVAGLVLVNFLRQRRRGWGY